MSGGVSVTSISVWKKQCMEETKVTPMEVLHESNATTAQLGTKHLA